MAKYLELEEIREIRSIITVNSLLKEGWIYLGQSAGSIADSADENRAYIIYSLGRLRDDRDSLNEWT